VNLSQVESLSARLAALVSQIDNKDESGDASAEEVDVLLALLDCHEELERICDRWRASTRAATAAPLRPYRRKRTAPLRLAHCRRD
jgi:hypothetical protein